MATTQYLTSRGQLEFGVRYFDIRIGLKKDIRNIYEAAYSELFLPENFTSFEKFKVKAAIIRKERLEGLKPSLKDIHFMHGYFNGWEFEKGITDIVNFINYSNQKVVNIPTVTKIDAESGEISFELNPTQG